MVTIFNGVQRVGVVAINLVYPLLVFRTVNAPAELITSLLAAGMIILGITTFMQASRLGQLGQVICVRQLSPPLIWRLRCLQRGSAAFLLFSE